MEGSSGTRGHGCLSAAGPPGSSPLTLFHLSFVQTADDQPCDKGRPGIRPPCTQPRLFFCGMSGWRRLPTPWPTPVCGSHAPLALCTSPTALPAGRACSLRLQSYWGWSPSLPAWHTSSSLSQTPAGLIVTGQVTGWGRGRASETSLLVHSDLSQRGWDQACWPRTPARA